MSCFQDGKTLRPQLPRHCERVCLGKMAIDFIVKEQFLGRPVRTGAWVARALPDTARDSFLLLPTSRPSPAKDVSVVGLCHASCSRPTGCPRLQQPHRTAATTAGRSWLPGNAVDSFGFSSMLRPGLNTYFECFQAYHGKEGPRRKERFL